MFEVEAVELYWTWIGKIMAVVCETGFSKNLIRSDKEIIFLEGKSHLL